MLDSRPSLDEDCGKKNGRFPLSLAVAVTYQLQKIRIAAEARFWDYGTNRVQSVNHLLFEVVDNATEHTKVMINTGSGKLSKPAKKRAIKALQDFVQLIHNSNGCVSALTLGRGLVDLASDDKSQAEFLKQLRHTGCSVGEVCISSQYFFEEQISSLF
mmetsp:Transcript_12922/g.19676  ORF Transcript_12922/g.19676 Transcript_12922/m.19676 type:complete len:158 (+) Transcript_12922:456-929(+)